TVKAQKYVRLPSSFGRCRAFFTAQDSTLGLQTHTFSEGKNMHSVWRRRRQSQRANKALAPVYGTSRRPYFPGCFQKQQGLASFFYPLAERRTFFRVVVPQG
ncbi:unnamed protein product, partial [Ectocarpus sp. 12 AP-2014]